MCALKLFALLIVALLPAEEGAARADTISVQTDRAVYGPFDTVAVTLVNQRDSTVYLLPDGCLTLDGKPLPQIRFERLEADRWVPYSPGSACGGMARGPVPLPPGEPYTVRFQVGLFSPLPLGTYRYVFSLLEDVLQPETLLPYHLATSNAFEVAV